MKTEPTISKSQEIVSDMSQIIKCQETMLRELKGRRGDAVDTLKHYAKATIELAEATKNAVWSLEAPDKKQAERITELEKQVQTAPIRAFVEMYDNGHIDWNDVYSLVQSFPMQCSDSGFPQEWMNTVAEIWGRWDEAFSALSGYSMSNDFIDEIRAAIGMEKPNQEEVERG